MSGQNTGFIGLRIMGTSMAALSQRDTGFFAHTRSAIPESITVTARGTEIALQADVILFMLPDTPDVGLELFGEAEMAPEQLSQFEIGQQVFSMN